MGNVSPLDDVQDPNSSMPFVRACVGRALERAIPDIWNSDQEAISVSAAIWSVFNPAISRSVWTGKDEPRIISSQKASPGAFFHPHYLGKSQKIVILR